MKNLTAQQIAVVLAIQAGSSISVRSVAGSGKTSTLVAAHQSSNPPRTLCVAFNKRNAEDLAARMPPEVTCKTFNAIGHATWQKHLGRFLKVDARKLWRLWNTYRHAQELADNAQDIVKLARLAKVFGLSPSYGPTPKTQALPSLELWQEIAEEFDIEESQALLPHALWLLVESNKAAWLGDLDFDDQLYLPVAYDCVFEKWDRVSVDEAQDLSALQHEMVERLLAKGGQAVVVGDPAQCHPAGTQITLSGHKKESIENLRIGQELVAYSPRAGVVKGYRNQGRKLEDIKEFDYKGNLFAVEVASRTTKMTANHKVLCRIPKEARERYCLYLMQKGSLFRLGISKLYYEASGGVFGPAMRARQEKAEKLWILQDFSTEVEARIAEKVCEVRFGIPDLIFEYGRASTQNPEFHQYIHNWAWEKIEKTVNMKANAQNILDEYGKLFEFPLWTAEHYDDSATKFSTQSFVTEICNVLPKSFLMFYGGDGARTIFTDYPKISWSYWEGKVYGITVEPTEGGKRLYFADGIVVHNSIYGFRGADTNSFHNITERFHLDQMKLTVSFRCPEAVCSEARKYVPDIESGTGRLGHCQKLVGAPELSKGLCIISRTNAPIVRLAFQAIRQGIPVDYLGRDFMFGLKALDAKHPTLESLEAWKRQQLGAAKGDSAKARIEDRYNSMLTIHQAAKEARNTPKAIINKLCEEAKVGNALMLSTVHRMKGGEKPNVVFLNYDKDLRGPQLANIRYVGVTRASESLVLHQEKDDFA